MIKIRALIKLYSGFGKRTIPIQSGYRPLVEIVQGFKVSGYFTLNKECKISPGEEGVIEIMFNENDLLRSNIKKGNKFQFYESRDALGEGEVLELVKSEADPHN